MSIQSRLLGRKKWYTLDDAARRLSVELGEGVTVRDVMQLVLDGDVGLCVMLQRQRAKRVVGTLGEPVPLRVGDVEFSMVRVPYGDVTCEAKTEILDGIYRVSYNHDFFQSLLIRDITGGDACLDGLGWCGVESADLQGELFMLFDYSAQYKEDLPQFGGLTLNQLVILKKDVDAFISSLDEQESGEPAEGEELRALEALGLLAETVAKQAPRYQRNNKPNKAQIAEVMSQQAGEVYGMSKSKLQRLLSDALDAWEEKRG
ncbi:MAG: hypothetical protein ACTH3D_05755 [Halomonas sp.]|uniref:hypothetical protein n=1 Tax=Halomonas sp. TaxID=1486246 RepID=UPI003F92BB65